jgi:hypothetical protein
MPWRPGVPRRYIGAVRDHQRRSRSWRGAGGPMANRGSLGWGLTRVQLAVQWEDEKRRWHEEAALSDELLCVFLPAELWLVVAQIVIDGPDLAVKRLAAAVDRLEATPIRPTKARPAGGYLSPGTVRMLSERVIRVFAILVDLRRNGYPSTLLDGWNHLPSRPAISAEFSGVTDRTAPNRRLCRLVFAAFRDVVLKRLGCDTIEELPDRISAMSTSQLENARVFRDLRMLTMLVVLLVTGTRRLAMVRIRRGDVDRRRVCWDGIPRPALGVRPAKGRPWDQLFYKPIPLPAGRIVKAWMLLVEGLAGEALTADDPLFPASRLNPPSDSSRKVTTMFSGYVSPPPRPATQRARPSLDTSTPSSRSAAAAAVAPLPHANAPAIRRTRCVTQQTSSSNRAHRGTWLPLASTASSSRRCATTR